MISSATVATHNGEFQDGPATHEWREITPRNSSGVLARPPCSLPSLFEKVVLPASKAVKTWSKPNSAQDMIQHELKAIDCIGMKTISIFKPILVADKAQKLERQQKIHQLIIIFCPYTHYKWKQGKYHRKELKTLTIPYFTHKRKDHIQSSSLLISCDLFVHLLCKW